MHTVLVHAFHQTPYDHHPVLPKPTQIRDQLIDFKQIEASLCPHSSALTSLISLHARNRSKGVGEEEERQGTGAAVRTSPCRAGQPWWQHHSAQHRAPPFSPMPLCSLAKPHRAQHDPEHAASAPCRARRAPPEHAHGRAMSPSAPERATPPLLARSVPRTPRNPDTPLHRPTAG